MSKKPGVPPVGEGELEMVCRCRCGAGFVLPYSGRRRQQALYVCQAFWSGHQGAGHGPVSDTVQLELIQGGKQEVRDG